jgi:hypothetical protein
MLLMRALNVLKIHQQPFGQLGRPIPRFHFFYDFELT